MATTEDAEAGLGLILLQHARHAIGTHLGAVCAPPPADRRLLGRGATFVTLTRDGSLRGCIGSLRAQRPLGEDVTANAVAAATRDPRFPALRLDELPDTRIEVSLLTEPRFLEVRDDEELLRCLRPGIDGLILFSGCRSATFLPQVWEQLPEPTQFLAALKQKAGLDPARPTPNLVAATYEVRKSSEPERGQSTS